MAAKIVTEGAKANRYLLAKIEFYKTLSQKTDEEICHMTGISTATMTRRKLNPGDFSISELRMIASVVGAAVADFIL